MILRSIIVTHILIKNCCIIPFYWLKFPRYLYIFLGYFYLKNLAKLNIEDEDQPKILTTTLIELGPSFVKLGQALSVRPDIVGAEFAKQLRQLQDKMPFFDGKEAISIIELEFGLPIDQLYKSFDKSPIAAASIAQVHKAKTLSGDTVAVKVMRNQTKQLMARDIKYFKRLARFLELFSKKARRLKLREAISNFANWTEQELDFIFEAICAEKLSKNFVSEPRFQTPKIYWQLTTSNVLTLEWIEGTRIDNIEQIKKMGFEPSQILAYSIQVFFLQVFRDGFFHGDIHPGNIFITKEGILRPLDFGIMGSLSKEQRQNLSSLLLGFIRRDYHLCTKAMIELRFLKNQSLAEKFSNSLARVVEPNIYKSKHGISVAQVFFEIINLAEEYDIDFDPSFLLLNKTMVQAEGTGKIVDPEKNIWLLTEEVMEKWLLETNGLEAKVERFLSRALKLFDEFSYSDISPKSDIESRSQGSYNDRAKINNKFDRFLSRALLLVVVLSVAFFGIMLLN